MPKYKAKIHMHRQGLGVFSAEPDKRLTITDTVEANTPYEARNLLAERHNVKHKDVVSPTQIDENDEPISSRTVVPKGCLVVLAILLGLFVLAIVFSVVLGLIVEQYAPYQNF